MITHSTVRALTKALEDGKITEQQYALQLKRLYDSSASTFDKETIDFVESKFEKLGIPFANAAATDGIIKQAVSGLLEGFTTFGFADTPDTPTEKIVNNISHLIGLAPGIMAGGLTMLTGATRTVANALQKKGKKEVAKRLMKHSQKFATGNQKLSLKLGTLAERLTLRDEKGKRILSLSGRVKLGYDRKGRALYELKSIPGKLADVVQSQGSAYLRNSNFKGMEFLTKGLLKNKFTRQSVEKILNESAHVGLLMAFSQHPFATRAEGEWGTGDRIKNMAMAGMHGAIAGGIFGTIGEYANIAKLMGSKVPAIRKTGEGLIRNTAKALALRTTDREVYSLINTTMKAGSGAVYGTATSAMYDLPVEEQIYETLMGVFFSVNSRSSFENRATQSIIDKQNHIKKSYSMEEAKEWLKGQKFYQEENGDFQWYWSNYIESIREQQILQNQVIKTETALAFSQAIERAMKEGHLTEEQVDRVILEKGEQEGRMILHEEIIKKRQLAIDPDYEGPETYGGIDFLDLTKLAQIESYKTTTTPGNDIDFPLPPLNRIAQKVYEKFKRNKNLPSVSDFHKGIKVIYNKHKPIKKDAKGREYRDPVDIDKFVDEVVKTFDTTKGKQKKLFTPNDKRLLRQVALRYDKLLPKKHSYYISLMTNKQKKHPKDLSAPKPPEPTPTEDPSGSTTRTVTSGRRDARDKSQFKNWFIRTVDYLKVNEWSTTQDRITQQTTPIEVTKFIRPTEMRRERIWNKKTKKFEYKESPWINAKQWKTYQEEIHKKNMFIYGISSDTGRIEERKIPFERFKTSDPLYLVPKDRAMLYRMLKYGRSTKGKLASRYEMDNAVSTYIYRLISLNLIKSDKDINKKNLKKLIPKWRETEEFPDVAKMQKYLNQVDKSEIPYLEGKEYGLTDDNFTGIIMRDFNEGSSETDGTIIWHSSIFDRNVDYMGSEPQTGTAKGSLFSQADGIRGDIVGKFAKVRGKVKDDAFMEKHGVNFIIYSTAAKTTGGIIETQLNPRGTYPGGKKMKTYDGTIHKFKVPTKDFQWNLDVYEHIESNGRVNIMQQMFLNLNTSQFDPETPIGRAFWKSWDRLLAESAIGDSKETAKADARFKDGKDLDGIDIDKVDINTLNTIMKGEGISSKAAKSIMKHIYTKNKNQLIIDFERELLGETDNMILPDILADVDYSITELMRRGHNSYVQRTFRKYILSRIVRPEIGNSYHVVLGPYDFHISSKKQKYSKAKKGLADDEFMLWGGARNNMELEVPIIGHKDGKLKNIKLGKFWDTWMNMQEPRSKWLKKYTAEERNAYEEARLTLSNRSPVLTSGNMRTLKFVGFVEGTGDRGMMIVTNRTNDFYYGGADKDIDSAHISWSMPKGILEGYKQEHVQNESNKNKKGTGNPDKLAIDDPDHIDFKNKNNAYAWAGAEYPTEVETGITYLYQKTNPAGLEVTSRSKDAIGRSFSAFNVDSAVKDPILKNKFFSIEEAYQLVDKGYHKSMYTEEALVKFFGAGGYEALKTFKTMPRNKLETIYKNDPEYYDTILKKYADYKRKWTLYAKGDKGRNAPIKLTDQQLYKAYFKHWSNYASKNQRKIQDLHNYLKENNISILTDQFAGSRVNQARAISEILNSRYGPTQKEITDNLWAMLDPAQKIQSGVYARYGKVAIGPLSNFWVRTKAQFDLYAQKYPEQVSKEVKIEEFNHLLLRNATTSNAYIDSGELGGKIWKTQRTMDAIEKRLYIKHKYKPFKNGDNLLFQQFHNAIIKGVLPDRESYSSLSQKVLNLYKDKKGFYKMAAEQLKDLDMEINPWAGIGDVGKANLFQGLRKLAEAIDRHPYSSVFQIRNMIDTFMPKGIMTLKGKKKSKKFPDTKSELERQWDNPHFANNKMHIIGVAKALAKTEVFIKDVIKITEPNLLMGRNEMELFARELIHAVAKQKEGFTSKRRMNKDPNRMGLSEQIKLSKQYLEEELNNYFLARAQLQHKGGIPSKDKQKLYKMISDLYDIWWLANPYIEMDMSNTTNTERQDYAKRQGEYNRVKDKLLKLVQYGTNKQTGKWNKTVRGPFMERNMQFWHRGDEIQYGKLMELLQRYSYDARNFQDSGPYNMNRVSGISKEARVEMAEAQEAFLEAMKIEEPKAREKKLFQTQPYLEVAKAPESPGSLLDPQIEQIAKWIPESLVPWDTVKNVHDLRNHIKELQKEVDTYKLEAPLALDYELDRFETNIYVLLKGGNKAAAMDIAAQYANTFQRLDIVAKDTISDIDYEHLRILNNMFENAYITTWKEWIVRKTTHKKLIKAWKELGLDPDTTMLGPEWATDLLFPSELGKFMRKYEKLFKVKRVHIVDKKTGKFKEYGVRVPTSTMEMIGETIGKNHDAGNALAKAYENAWNGHMDIIRTDNPKLFAKYEDVLFALTAIERQMGIKSDEPWDKTTGPRPHEHKESLANLENKLNLFRDDFSKLPKDLTFRIKSAKDETVREYTPREIVDMIKHDILTPFYTKMKKEIFDSNYEGLRKVLSPKVLSKFGKVFDARSFYGLHRNDTLLSEKNPAYWKIGNSELLLNEHGIIDFNKLKYIHEYNISHKELQSGNKVIERNFHESDLDWMHRQIDIYLDVLSVYGKQVGSEFKIEYKSMNPKELAGLRAMVRGKQTEYLRNVGVGEIGMSQIDGQAFSTRYWSLMEQTKTKKGMEYVKNVHIPRELDRILGPVIKEGPDKGKRDHKKGYSLEDIEAVDMYKGKRVRDRILSIYQAREEIAKNMMNKLLKGAYQDSPFFYEQIESVMNSYSTRDIDPQTSTGKQTHARSRAIIPVDNYAVDGSVPKKYAERSARGLTQGWSALQIRLFLIEFKNRTKENKFIRPEEAERWHLKMIDLVRGYMGYDTTRNLNIHGVSSEKDMVLLHKWRLANYKREFIVDEQLGPVEAKLLLDFDQVTRPREDEIGVLENEYLGKMRKEIKKIDIAKNKELAKMEKQKKSKKQIETYKEKMVFKKLGKYSEFKRRIRIKIRGIHPQELEGLNRVQLVKIAVSKSTALDTSTKFLARHNMTSDQIKHEILESTRYNSEVFKMEMKNKRDFLGDIVSKKTGEILENITIDKKLNIYSKDGKKIDTKLVTSNVDKMNIQKSFRSFYSDETVGNVMLRIDHSINKALGFINPNFKVFKDLPDMKEDPQGRHRAWVSRLHWVSDMEGKFEMMSLLAHPKSAVANIYGGTTNLITDVGFEEYLIAMGAPGKMNELLGHFRGKEFDVWDPLTSKWKVQKIKNIEHIHQYFENYGFLENNIQYELAQLQPSTDTKWQNFVNDRGDAIAKYFKARSLYTSDKDLNAKHRMERDKYMEKTLVEAMESHGITKKMNDAGSYFMKHSERHLRVKTAIAHYLKAKRIFTDGRGNLEVSEEFLLEYAKRGIAATQFIYHATNRPGFANTAFGRMMTRFHPYGWNSVRRRANIISDRMLTEGFGDFEANRRFERQLTADMMVSALSLIFTASLFEYALSPPMNWAIDASQLMFGDERERERAFYNQYGHPLLAPLQIVTPPVARFALGPMVGIINQDFEAFWKYQVATWAPFGRLGRDVLRTVEVPEMWGEYMLGIPVHRLGRYQEEIEGDIEEENTDIEE